LTVEVGEVAVHLGSEPLTPPVEEIVRVVGEHRAQVGADLAGVLAALRHIGNVATAVLRGLSVGRRVGRDSGRVEIAVYPLGDPVGGEWSAKPAKHVVAREPPPADVEEHRRDRVRTVKVIQDPEEFRLPLLPINKEVLIAVKRAEYLVGIRVHLSSSPAGLHTNTRSVRTPGSVSLIRAIIDYL